MRAGHRDIKLAVVHNRIPRRIQRDICPNAFDVELPSLFACANQRFNSPTFQVNFANQVIFGVADIKRFSVQRDALRMIEFCFGKATVAFTQGTIANHILNCSIH